MVQVLNSSEVQDLLHFCSKNKKIKTKKKQTKKTKNKKTKTPRKPKTNDYQSSWEGW